MAKKILVVDDELEVVLLITRRLSKNGYTVLQAHTGPDAVNLAKKECPDLMILDVMIPAPDGLEICRILKSDSQSQSIKIILLTARDQQKDREVGLQAGADMYVTKPFEPDDLIKNIKLLLGE